MNLLEDDRQKYGLGAFVAKAFAKRGAIKTAAKAEAKTPKKDLSKPTLEDFENTSKEEVLDYIETIPFEERLSLYSDPYPSLKGKYEILDIDKIDFNKDVINFNKVADDYKSGDNTLLRAYMVKNNVPEKFVGDFDAAGEFKNAIHFKELSNGKIQVFIPPKNKGFGKSTSKIFTDPSKKQIEDFFKQRENKNMGGLLEDDREQYAVGGSLLADDMAMMNEEDMPIEETHMMPDGTEMPGASHEEDENMAPDGEMEKEFLDFILDEALSPEEEDMLMSRLEQDEELAMLFDKVIDVAQEFAGSGPVEGPGSGVSDSIPARLSDGEFVFTAAAVEEIGADNLMAMMKEAEAAVAERQGLAEGGMPEEEETVTMEVQKQKEPNVQIAKATVNNTRGLLDEDEISKGIKSKMMLDPLQKHVRS
jgi:uncharacterized protein (DUF1919 family)